MNKFIKTVAILLVVSGTMQGFGSTLGEFLRTSCIASPVTAIVYLVREISKRATDRFISDERVNTKNAINNIVAPVVGLTALSFGLSKRLCPDDQIKRNECAKFLVGMTLCSFAFYHADKLASFALSKIPKGLDEEYSINEKISNLGNNVLVRNTVGNSKGRAVIGHIVGSIII